jgi:hypothetical protein
VLSSRAIKHLVYMPWEIHSRFNPSSSLGCGWLEPQLRIDRVESRKDQVNPLALLGDLTYPNAGSREMDESGQTDSRPGVSHGKLHEA